MKISNDTTGNRTRVLPTCSALHQPTAPPRAPKECIYLIKISLYPKDVNIFDICCGFSAVYPKNSFTYVLQRSGQITFSPKCSSPHSEKIAVSPTNLKAVSPHPLKIGHMFIRTYLLGIVHTTTSENIYYSS